MQLTPSEQKILLKIARINIEEGWPDQTELTMPDIDPTLQQPGASFVTLNRHGQLRGCIGSLQAFRPLAEDVAHNAFSAAYKDPRFAPLVKSETDGLDIEISILSQPEPIPQCNSLEDLLNQLVPFEDGLILRDGFKRATFLPSVWEQLPDKKEFVAHLLRKGGMTGWSENMRCERYHTFKFGDSWEKIDIYN